MQDKFYYSDELGRRMCPKWNDGFEEDLKRCWRGIRDRLLKKQKQPPSDHDASLLFNLLPARLSEESRISLFIFSHYNRKNVDQFNLLRLCAAALSPSSLSHPPRPCLFHLHSRCCCIPFKCSHRASHTTQSTSSSAIVIKIIDRIMVRCIRMEALFSRRQEQVVLLLLLNFPVLLHLLFHSSAI